MIATLLEAFHRRVGFFVSPQINAVNDMISIDGQDMHPADFVRIYEEIAPFVEMVDARFDIPLSKFEVLTAIAFAAFADAPVDVAVIEAGMGGLWDSTNVADADVNVITPIGLDHTDYLGETIAEIAANKAGIIRNPDAVAVIAAQPGEALEPILARAVEVDAAVARYGSEFTVADSAIAVGGQTVQLRGLGGFTTTSSFPYRAPTRRRTRLLPSQRWKPSLVRIRATSWTRTRFAAVSRPWRCRAGCNAWTPPPQHSWTPLTTRPVPRRWRPPSSATLISPP